MHKTDADNDGPHNTDKASGVDLETGQVSVDNNGDHDTDGISLNEEDEEHSNMHVIIHDEKNDLMTWKFWKEDKNELKTPLTFPRKM